MNPIANVAPDEGLFKRSFTESFLTVATSVFFCACLSSFSHDKLELPPSSWDDFDSCGCSLQYRRSYLACSLLGRGYDVNGLSSSSFEPLFISDATFLKEVFARRYSGKRKRLTKSRLKSSIFLVGI